LGKGNTLREVDTSKKRGEGFRFGTKQGKMIKIAPALLLVVLLSGILSGLIIATVSSLYQASSTISSVGTFKPIGIGAYWDEACTRSVDALDWGFLAAGAQKSFTVYVSNEGALPMTLSLSTSNWNPEAASNYLTLTWDYNGQTVNADTTIPVTITLTVSEIVTGVDIFNFDVIAEGIYGT
jgi:hypothetical protein